MVERIAVPRRDLCHPHALTAWSFEDRRSSLVMTYGTSYYALKDRAQLKAGERLLVLGAAGGVGAAAVELGKAMGAEVIGRRLDQRQGPVRSGGWGPTTG